MAPPCHTARLGGYLSFPEVSTVRVLQVGKAGPCPMSAPEAGYLVALVQSRLFHLSPHHTKMEMALSRAGRSPCMSASAVMGTSPSTRGSICAPSAWSSSSSSAWIVAQSHHHVILKASSCVASGLRDKQDPEKPCSLFPSRIQGSVARGGKPN